MMKTIARLIDTLGKLSGLLEWDDLCNAREVPINVLFDPETRENY